MSSDADTRWRSVAVIDQAATVMSVENGARVRDGVETPHILQQRLRRGEGVGVAPSWVPTDDHRLVPLEEALAGAQGQSSAAPIRDAHSLLSEMVTVAEATTREPLGEDLLDDVKEARDMLADVVEVPDDE